MWQDLALSFIGIMFTIMLIPQLKDIISKNVSLNYTTCAVTGIGCIIISYIDITLNLHIAAVISIITGIIWLLLLIFSIKNDGRGINQRQSLNRDVSNSNIERG